MASLVAALVVLLAQAAPPAGATPVSPAAAGPAGVRVDCAPGRSRPSVWDRARAPHVGRYCDFLAHAEARLRREPRRSDQAAAAAAALFPDQAAPLVLRARAAVLQGNYGQGRQFFEQATALDAAAVREPGAQLALAVALRETGETARAIEAYRALVPRIDTIAGDEERTRAQIDAAVALMLEGPAGLEVASSLLRSATRGAPSLRSAAQAALALALDRAGAKAEAAALAAEAHRQGAQVALAPPGGRPAVGWQVEGLAVLARLREASEPAAAAGIWDAYLARAGQGPWAAHARSRLAEAKRAPGPRRKGAP